MTHEPRGAPTGGDDPLLGALLVDRYRLLEKIGEGAMGAVYRGVHETLRKPVAVKLLGRAARNDREVAGLAYMHVGAPIPPVTERLPPRGSIRAWR